MSRWPSGGVYGALWLKILVCALALIFVEGAEEVLGAASNGAGCSCPLLCFCEGAKGANCPLRPSVPFELSAAGAAPALAALGRPLRPRCPH